MLPSLPPTKLSGDFDPSSAQEILEEDDDRQDGPKAELSSVEINILIYLVRRFLPISALKSFAE